MEQEKTDRRPRRHSDNINADPWSGGYGWLGLAGNRSSMVRKCFLSPCQGVINNHLPATGSRRPARAAWCWGRAQPGSQRAVF